ncbi:MAG: hypothetical protein AVDCRST_MAG93-5881 [uncultured Chloroflexia bacterium]|uniref:Uncharacterized protein n=1 Tax=uncultured Chloroflexia bacterium TaxID=1672391 RepID=A0A6J4L4T7_9CHLR|nr:MAG: hypothetical protein AVDCRST_MAG93-5881 [uncultured Chloroflexia bacterium]
MKMYVGVTDRQWFEFLAQRGPDEVNFWRPSRTNALVQRSTVGVSVTV